MKFTVEYRVLMKMLELVGKCMPGQKRADKSVKLSACAARVFVEANGTTGGVEVLLFADGECVLPRKKFVAILKTYRGRKNLTMEASAGGLRIDGFTMPVESFRPHATPPAKFQVFPVTDLDVLTPEQAASSGPVSQAPEIRSPPVPPVVHQAAPPSVAGLEKEAVKRRLEWEFFAPEIIERLFVVYTHKLELEWAERMWDALTEQSLTEYATAADFNRVLVRLAVLARYFKCWVWKAYDDWGDPYWEDYDDWFQALPFVRSALPHFGQQGAEGQQPSSKTEPDSERDLLHHLMREENDRVFSAVMASYGDCQEVELALDLRHAAGIADEFGAHVSFSEHEHGVTVQEEFFNEYGLSLREFDCASVIIGNRFYF